MSDMHNSLREVSRITLDIAQKLATLDEGATATYDELTTAAGKNVQNEARSFLYSAIRRVEREYAGRHFATVRGVGIQRLTPNNAVDVVAGGGVEKIRRVSRRSQKRASRIHVDQLNDDQKKRYGAHVAVLAVVGLFTRSSSLKRLTTKASVSAPKLDINTTLDLFRKK